MSNLVSEGGSGLFVASSIGHQDAIVANVDALVPAQAGLRFMGYSVKESAGTPAAAKVAIKHSATGAGGTDMAYINLAASGSDHQWFGPDGIATPNGISVGYGAGQVDLAVYYKVVT